MAPADRAALRRLFGAGRADRAAGRTLPRGVERQRGAVPELRDELALAAAEPATFAGIPVKR